MFRVLRMSYVVFVLAALLVAIPAPLRTVQGIEWRAGDLFVGVGDPAWRDSLGKYLVLDAAASVRTDLVLDRARSFTTGCAVDSVNGHLITTSFDANTVTRFENAHDGEGGEHLVVQQLNLRPYTFVNGRARGAVKSVLIDANGSVLAGTVNGTNLLLKLSPSGAVQDRYAIPAQGAHWFDLASDQRTVFYTSGDNVVRRYDLATRSAAPDFATLIDGSIHALRLLPDGQGLLVAGSVGITRLDMDGGYVTRYWLPERQFTTVNLTPDGRQFWTSTQFGELFRFDIASERVVAGPIATGFARVHGLCMKQEYTAAEGMCRTVDADGGVLPAACPRLEICSNLVDDDGDGMNDAADPDCSVPGRLHEIGPVVTPEGITPASANP